MKVRKIFLICVLYLFTGCSENNLSTEVKNNTNVQIAEVFSETDDNEETMEIYQKENISGNSKGILIAYFTMPETDDIDTSAGASRVIADDVLCGNMEFMANVIEKAVGGEKFEIKTVQEYPTIHKPLVDFADKELENNVRPELSVHIESLDNYDTIFIGYPIWWGDMPMPLYSFFDEYDFSGKTIIPFSSHGGSRFAGTVEIISELEPNADVKDGFTVSRDDIAENYKNVADYINSWINELNIK